MIFKSMEDYISDLLPKDKSASILDIGCGEGDFLQFLINKGYRSCQGIDISERAVKICRNKGIENVKQIDDLASYLAPQKEAFDLINMKEVLYYFPEEKMHTYLGMIRSSLKKEGLLIVEVFNGALLTGDFFKYKDHEIRYIFTEHSLRKVLEDSGFRVMRIFGTRIKCSNIKRFIWRGLRFLWSIILKAIYTLELGGGEHRPTIWSKLIVAVAKKTE